jgi:hypothetical protein
MARAQEQVLGILFAVNPKMTRAADEDQVIERYPPFHYLEAVDVMELEL